MRLNRCTAAEFPNLRPVDLIVRSASVSRNDSFVAGGFGDSIMPPNRGLRPEAFS